MMTTDRRDLERHEPTRSARLAVRVATSVIPRGPARARYRQEFLAELHLLDVPDQRAFAAGILSTAWTLRRVLRKDPTMRDLTITKPWRCRLGWHRYQTGSAEDGGLYHRCVRCGNDRPEHDFEGGQDGGNDFLRGASL